MKKEKNINTPYDDVFRTLLVDCPELIIPVVNEVFNKSYGRNANIVSRANEHFLTQQDGKQDKVITDSNLIIEGVSYQIECQSTADGDMIIRVWEYESQIALQDAVYDKEKCILTLKFPNTAILYLRHDENTPDNTTVIVEFQGAKCTYTVPNIKLTNYTVEDIFEKKLYFFIPFHIFSYESMFESYDDKTADISELKNVITNVFTKLNNCSSDELSECVKALIIDMSKKVCGQLTKKYPNVQKGIGDVMGGKVLEYRSKDIRLEVLFKLVIKNAISIATASEEVNMPEKTFQEKFDAWKAQNLVK